MTDSNNSSTDEVIDKNKLWGWWYKDKQWQSDLHRKASHKALDIPEEMGDITSTTSTQTGMGWKELVALGGLGLGGLYVMNDGKKEYVTPPPTPAATAPADSEYEVRFYDKDGNQITVPRFQPKP